VTKTPNHEVYTHSHHPVVVAAHAARIAEEAAAFMLPRLDDDMAIIDLGCGPGSITVGLGDAVAEGRVVGVDAAEGIVREAAVRAAERGADNVTFVVASVYELPFPDASFDAAYAHQLLQHLAEPVAALVEAKRVLRRGGLIGVRDADYGTMTHYPHDPRLRRWLEIYREVARHNGGQPDAGRRLPAWLRAAGFADIVATTSTWTYADPESRADWAGLWARRNQIEGPFTQTAFQEGITDIAELRDIGDAFHEWAAAPDGWFAFIHGEAVGTAR
jgi:SAM-dependent methyltransferase